MISEPSTPDSTDPFAHPAPPGSRPRLAILGAGPVGLEAALAAREGGFPHRVYEKARQPAGHVRRWGHVRLFTPWRMNVSERMRRALAEAGIPFELDPEEAPTGHDYADALLDPLWHSPLLSGALHTGTEVVGVTRAGLLKDDAIGSPDRGAGPFRILLRDGRGRERAEYAEIVLDCTGVRSRPNPLGDGGIPAPGETALESRIHREIPDFEDDAGEWSGRTILLTGGGHSAQTAARALDRIARHDPDTRVLWALRAPLSLAEDPADDPLPHRAELARAAQALARGEGALEVLEGFVVDALEPAGGRVAIRLRRRDGAEMRTVEAERILALHGGVPDDRIHRQLQFHECYATSGPMKLAAALLGSAGGDCLTQESHGVETLLNPEPDFFVLGEKSYGRNNTFLLQVGWSQVDEIFGHLADR
jgi:hypothetical protein